MNDGKVFISTHEFARRFGGCSVRTIERLYERRTPNLPKIVRANRRKLFDAREVDRFLNSLADSEKPAGKIRARSTNASA